MIINATNIGKNLSGIGRCALSLSLYFLEHWNYPFRLFINEQALVHFKKIQNRNKIRVIGEYTSPDLGFRGHLSRLLWTNKMSLQNQKSVLFNMSPLEGCLFHKRQIITIHDLIPLLFPKYHQRQYHYYKYLLPIILKSSIKIIAVSKHTRDLIIDFYKVPEEKVSVVYNGISRDFLNKESSDVKQNYLLYVGRFSPMKNIRGLIRAFGVLINRHNFDLKLKLVGGNGNGNRKELNNIDSQIRENIEVICNISDKDLTNLYKDASLFILPSFYEGFGLPPLEAMACGCPVVISNIASLPEICRDAAYYIDPYDVESMVEGIYEVLTNESLRRTLIQRGFERTKLFDWEKSAKEHLKIFEEVLTQ